ncbi:MAG: hypothetical protein EAZ87_21625 [Nostocales cyanobacterium]|nr:MAG: hypothetical protein EAZ87_21625 [Nostocales cyanobacterium]
MLDMLDMRDNINLWMQPAQKLGNSLQNQLEKTTDKTINTVNNTFDQAQSSLTAITNSTSAVMETTINNYFSDYFSDFVIRYPIVLKTLKTCTWVINHPVMSAIILLLIIAFIWSIIKGIVRLIETASWSIFKVPLKLLQALFLIVWKKLIQLIPVPKFKLDGLLKFTKYQDLTTLSVNNMSFQDKQERLLAINHRLELIHQEQQQLLKEAAILINSDNENLLIDK